MYHHVKKLMYTVRVDEPDPKFGNMLLEQFGGANGELSIVGDFEPEQIRPQHDGMLADWKAPAPKARLPTEGRNELTSKHTNMNTPDKENAVYFAATVMPLSDTDSDYPEIE